MISGQRLLMAGAVLAALLTSNAALAEGGVGPVEKWDCTVTKTSGNNIRPVQYSLQEGQLIAQPLGAPRYQVLDNTQYAVIAVDHMSEPDPLYDFESLYVATVMIDRKSGYFTTTLSYTGAAPVHQTGSCVRLNADDEPAAAP